MTITVDGADDADDDDDDDELILLFLFFFLFILYYFNDIKFDYYCMKQNKTKQQKKKLFNIWITTGNITIYTTTKDKYHNNKNILIKII